VRRARGAACRRSTVPRALPAVALLLVLVGGCAGGRPPVEEGDPPATAPTAHPRRDLADAVLWLSFEEESVGYDGSPEYADARGGPLVGRVVTANGGSVDRTPGAGGTVGSVSFPARCTAPRGCPRAMVEVAADPGLDPREDAFEYGATVWLAPDKTSVGSNIVQKGRYGEAGGQWKLQVDSKAGEPSCVVRSGDDLLIVRSRVSIADSRWHEVVCRRDEHGISIRVDDTVDRRSGRTGPVVNPSPVRVGSPGVGDQDDQFHGRLDDVFLWIDR
jgi:hypothetical protein